MTTFPATAAVHRLLPPPLPIPTHFSSALRVRSGSEPEPGSDAPQSKSFTKGTGFGGGVAEVRKGKKSVIRRIPIERPPVVASDGGKEEKERSVNENAFLLTWLGLGLLIFVEGIALASSGFLPEEWDNFLVKYLYPSFTPTVVLFVGGTVVYGVIKYLEGEEMRK